MIELLFKAVMYVICFVFIMMFAFIIIPFLLIMVILGGLAGLLGVGETTVPVGRR